MSSPPPKSLLQTRREGAVTNSKASAPQNSPRLWERWVLACDQSQAGTHEDAQGTGGGWGGKARVGFVVDPFRRWAAFRDVEHTSGQRRLPEQVLSQDAL